MDFLASLVAQHLPTTRCGAGPTVSGKDVRSTFRFVDALEENMAELDPEDDVVPDAGDDFGMKKLPCEGSVINATGEPIRTQCTPPMRFNYTVPDSVEPGSVITIDGPHGKLGVQVPHDARVGEETAAWLGPVYQSVVPEGKKPGDMILSKLGNGKEISVVVPPDKKPGEAFDFCPPVLMVRVPEGATSGDLLAFRTPDGQEQVIAVPPSVPTSGYFEVELAAAEGPSVHRAHATFPMNILFVVPEGASPGAKLMIDGPHGKMEAIVPEAASPGEEVSIWIGPSIKYVAVVPEGKRPGDILKLQLADGKQITVPVAAGKQAGDTFEFAPPVLMVQAPVGCKVGDTLVFATPDGREDSVQVPQGIVPLQYFDVPYAGPSGAAPGPPPAGAIPPEAPGSSCEDAGNYEPLIDISAPDTAATSKLAPADLIDF